MVLLEPTVPAHDLGTFRWRFHGPLADRTAALVDLERTADVTCTGSNGELALLAADRCSG